MSKLTKVAVIIAVVIAISFFGPSIIPALGKLTAAQWGLIAVSLSANVLLTRKPNIPDLSSGDAGSIRTMIRNASPPLRWVWGRRRVGGFVIRMETLGQYESHCIETGIRVVERFGPSGSTSSAERVCLKYERRAKKDNATYLYFVAVLTSHPLTAIHEVYINNELILFTNHNNKSVNERDGEVADQDTVIDYCGSNNIRGDAREQMINNHNRYRDYIRINARLDGTSEAFPYVDRGGRAGEILERDVGDDNFILPGTGGLLGRGGDKDGGLPPDVWNSKTDRATGMSLVAVRMRWDRKIWVNGEPRIEFVVDGKKVFDPRSGKTEYSANGALVIADVIKTLPGIDNRGIDEERLIAAANACDIAPERRDQASPDGNATDTAFEIHGVVQSTDEAGAVLEQMSKSIGGSVVESPAGWRIYAGDYLAPTMTITDDMVDGSVIIRPKRALDDRLNGLQARYIDVESGYDWVDTPIITNKNYIAEDNDTELLDQTDFPYVTRIGQASRLLQIGLRRERAEERLAFSISDPFVGFSLEPYNNINVKIDDLNIDGVYKLMSVTQSVANDTLLFDLELDSEDPDAYTFHPEFQNFDVKSFKSNIPQYDGRYAPQPNNLQIDSSSAQLLKQADGTVAERMLVSWAQATDFREDTVLNVFKLPVDGILNIPENQWRDAPHFTTRANEIYINTNQVIDPYPESRLYRVIVRHRNWLDSEGTPSILDHELLGKADKPLPPIDLAAVQRGLAVVLTFRVSPIDADALQANVIYWRRQDANELPNITAADLHTGTSIGSHPVAHGESKQIELVSLQEGYYLFAVRIEDTTGNMSEHALVRANYGIRRDLVEHVLTADDGTRTLMTMVDNALVPHDGVTEADKTDRAWQLEEYGNRPYDLGGVGRIDTSPGTRSVYWREVNGRPENRFITIDPSFPNQPSKGTITTDTHSITRLDALGRQGQLPNNGLNRQMVIQRIDWGIATAPGSVDYLDVYYTISGTPPRPDKFFIYFIPQSFSPTDRPYEVLNTDTAEFIEDTTPRGWHRLRWQFPIRHLEDFRDQSQYAITFYSTRYLEYGDSNSISSIGNDISPSSYRISPRAINNFYGGDVNRVDVTISCDVFIPPFRPSQAGQGDLWSVNVSNQDYYYDFYYTDSKDATEFKSVKNLTGTTTLDRIIVYRWYVVWHCDRVGYNVGLRNINVRFNVR